jgi:mono/diheme cytochrome c family protein
MNVSSSTSRASQQERPVGRRGAGLGIGLAAAAALGLALLPTAASAQGANGAKIYGTICGACHQATGTGVSGVFPPLAGSEWVTGAESRVIKVILHGLTGDIEVNGETYSSTMPPFGTALKDAEVAAVATYIRTSWGNKATPVTAATVAKTRAATATRKKPWTAKELNADVKAPAKK